MNDRAILSSIVRVVHCWFFQTEQPKRTATYSARSSLFQNHFFELVESNTVSIFHLSIFIRPAQSACSHFIFSPIARCLTQVLKALRAVMFQRITLFTCVNYGFLFRLSFRRVKSK